MLMGKTDWRILIMEWESDERDGWSPEISSKVQGSSFVVSREGL
jgi:hypothetical protein